MQRLGVFFVLFCFFSVVILYTRARHAGSGKVRWEWSGGCDVAAAAAAVAAPVPSSTAGWKRIPEPTTEAWTHRGQRTGG